MIVKSCINFKGLSIHVQFVHKVIFSIWRSYARLFWKYFCLSVTIKIRLTNLKIIQQFSIEIIKYKYSINGLAYKIFANKKSLCKFV